MENYIEWIGFLASFFILVSLLMASIKKLRIINLIGALIFAYYGFQISSPSVFGMNAAIVLINIYYLKQIYTSKDYFKVLPVQKNEEYTRELVDFYRRDIEKFMSVPDDVFEQSTFRFLVLRNMNPAGIFVARRFDDETLEIVLDYATPQFQDFKTGAHIYEKERTRFKTSGFKKFTIRPSSETHENYLQKMGFKRTDINNEKVYIKNI